jgi:hypothetical protein
VAHQDGVTVMVYAFEIAGERMRLADIICLKANDDALPSQPDTMCLVIDVSHQWGPFTRDRRANGG